MRYMLVRMILLCLFMASGEVAHAAESGSQADMLDQQMVLVPAGKFTRGSDHADDEKPARSIYLNALMPSTWTSMR